MEKKGQASYENFSILQNARSYVLAAIFLSSKNMQVNHVHVLIWCKDKTLEIHHWSHKPEISEENHDELWAGHSYGQLGGLGPCSTCLLFGVWVTQDASQHLRKIIFESFVDFGLDTWHEFWMKQRITCEFHINPIQVCSD